MLRRTSRRRVTTSYPATSADPEVGVIAARALAALVSDGRTRELVIRKVDGGDVAGSPFRERLLAAGFAAGYRGLVLHAARTGT